MWTHEMRCATGGSLQGVLSALRIYGMKGVVEGLILRLVDDVLALNKYSNEAVISNTTVKKFMEPNKLKLSG